MNIMCLAPTPTGLVRVRADEKIRSCGAITRDPLLAFAGVAARFLILQAAPTTPRTSSSLDGLIAWRRGGKFSETAFQGVPEHPRQGREWSIPNVKSIPSRRRLRRLSMGEQTLARSEWSGAEAGPVQNLIRSSPSRLGMISSLLHGTFSG
jgi:hypothetical protein